MENVLPHSSLEQLAPNLWILEGTLPHGIPLPRNMVIFRTQEGKLWVHSPVAVDDKTKKEIDALGEVAWIVVPNDMHRLDAPTWKESYQQARVICPKAARKKVAKKVSVDGISEEEFIKGEIKAYPMVGATRDELSYEVELEEGRALVVNDLLVNVEKLPGILGKVFKLMGRIGRFRVPTPQTFLFLHQKKLFKAWLEKMAKRNYSIVTVSHGKPITKDVSGWFMRAATGLAQH